MSTDTSVHANLCALRADLADNLIDRTEAIDAAILALVTREHALFLGPPGTARRPRRRSRGPTRAASSTPAASRWWATPTSGSGACGSCLRRSGAGPAHDGRKSRCQTPCRLATHVARFPR